MTAPTLLVFSHLRWCFVYQRPQHLMSRLARHWNVVFVEEPVRCEGPARLEVREIAPQLSVLVPHTPVEQPGFHDDQLADLQRLVGNHLANGRLGVDVAWVYTPLALPLAQAFKPTCVVYDCMDELAAFKDAPLALRQREAALMKVASLVLTGGPSLYESRRHRHPHVVCLPSAVDAQHYAPARLRADSTAGQEAERVQGHLPGPRLGFFGVIDERLDAGLVDRLAAAHPEWSIVMAGPVVKIDPERLPRRPNIHWLGMQPYGRLPHLLAGWDVALMPFALNESTRFISPTKTLEYMAGEKPVVSTPVQDVIALYGDAVTVAEPGEAFVRACEAVLAEGADARCRRALAMLACVGQHSWSRSADSVHLLMSEALLQARRRRLQAVADVEAVAPARPARPLPTEPVRVLRESEVAPSTAGAVRASRADREPIEAAAAAGGLGV